VDVLDLLLNEQLQLLTYPEKQRIITPSRQTLSLLDGLKNSSCHLKIPKIIIETFGDTAGTQICFLNHSHGVNGFCGRC
jgi:hypothetical protein